MVPTPFLRSLRTARSVAVAGIIFAVTLTATLYLFRASFPLNSVVGPETTLAAEDISRGRIALFLLPYVGISFLWFMGALNYSLGHADNRLFTTVFLSSGILFIGLSFVAGAVGAAELSALAAGLDAARMAAVFCLAVSTFGRLRKLLPPWLSWLGTATGVFLLLVPFGVEHVQYVFPAWVTVLSIYLLVRDPGGQPRTQPPAHT